MSNFSKFLLKSSLIDHDTQTANYAVNIWAYFAKSYNEGGLPMFSMDLFHLGDKAAFWCTKKLDQVEWTRIAEGLPKSSRVICELSSSTLKVDFKQEGHSPLELDVVASGQNTAQKMLDLYFGGFVQAPERPNAVRSVSEMKTVQGTIHTCGTIPKQTKINVPVKNDVRVNDAPIKLDAQVKHDAAITNDVHVKNDVVITHDVPADNNAQVKVDVPLKTDVPVKTNQPNMQDAKQRWLEMKAKALVKNNKAVEKPVMQAQPTETGDRGHGFQSQPIVDRIPENDVAGRGATGFARGTTELGGGMAERDRGIADRGQGVTKEGLSRMVETPIESVELVSDDKLSCPVAEGINKKRVIFHKEYDGQW